MRKHLLVFVTMVVVFAGTASAFAYQYSGELMFVMEKNEQNYAPLYTDIETRMEQWFVNKGITRDIELQPYDKIDQGKSSENGFMTITYGTGNLYGTWATEKPIEFYSVKGGTEFAFYWLSTPSSEGFWTTDHLKNGGGNVPAISHLSAWNPGTADTVVPEPGTIVLLGLGLLGVVGLGRKKFSGVSDK